VHITHEWTTPQGKDIAEITNKTGNKLKGIFKIIHE